MSAVTPVTVAVTGAAGRTGYALLPRIASRARVEASVAELVAERDAVRAMGLL